MAITYNFTNIQLEVAPKRGELENIVTRITYQYNGEDEKGFKSSVSGMEIMRSPNTSDFKIFNTLTEVEVITWLNQSVNIVNMQRLIEGDIKLQRNPRFVTITNPWDQAV